MKTNSHEALTHEKHKSDLMKSYLCIYRYTGCANRSSLFPKCNTNHQRNCRLTSIVS